MDVDRLIRYTITLDADEMSTFADIVQKLARPDAGFQRPSFTSDELIMIAELDTAIHGEQPKGPNITSV